MNWLDAIVEMKKDNSKVFKVGNLKVKIQDNELIQFLSDHNGWEVKAVLTCEQKEDWVEVKQFKEVDYSEFMEWYCNPNNKGKEFRYKDKLYSGEVMINYMSYSPIFFHERCSNFQIPND